MPETPDPNHRRTALTEASAFLLSLVSNPCEPEEGQESTALRLSAALDMMARDEPDRDPASLPEPWPLMVIEYRWNERTRRGVVQGWVSRRGADEVVLAGGEVLVWSADTVIEVREGGRVVWRAAA